ncbi:hypothetical protein ACI782_25505 [Geodermatophilus sp. SYSU D00703]
MTAALPTAPFALRDVEDLADADLDAELAERLEPAAWVGTDAAELAGSIGAAAVAAHVLGARARDLLG